MVFIPKLLVLLADILILDLIYSVYLESFA